MVYKYYPPTDYTFDALCGEYFFFSKVRKLNDPYDTSFNLIRGSKLSKRLIAEGRISPDADQIMNDYATCSFSAVKNSMHLWAFYANNFSGVVVGYDDSKFNEITESLKARIFYYKVLYIDKMFDVDKPFEFTLHNLTQGDKLICSDKLFKGDSKLDDDFFAYLYTIKHKAIWSEEMEYRLIAANDVVQQRDRLEMLGVKYTDAGYKIPMPNNVIKEIIIGHNFPKERIDHIKQIAHKNGIGSIKRTTALHPFIISFEDLSIDDI